ncbi:MAG: hypothetical protein QM675_02135 [Protaetiibacter sp.]
MTDALPGEPRVFRPSWPVFHRRMLVRLVWFSPLLLMALLLAAWPSVGLGIMALGTGLLLGGIGLAVYFGRTTVTIESGELRIRGPLRTRRWPLPAIATLVFVPLPGRRRASLYGVSPLLERMFALSAETWEEDELEGIAASIGAPVVRAPAGLTGPELQERYPGTVGWTTTRPWLFVLLLTCGTAVLMFAVAVVATIVLIATGQVTLPTGD